MIPKFFFLASMAAMISGCATVGSIERSYSRINRDDGIDKEEAVAIAQWDLLHHEQVKSRYSIAGPEVFEGKERTSLFGGSEFDTWIVVFGPKNIFVKTFGIFPPAYALTIDKAKGRIVKRSDDLKMVHFPEVLSEIDKEKKREAAAKNKKKFFKFW